MQELPVINRTQELYEAVSGLTDKLPSLKRQTLGRRLEDSLLNLLELLIMLNQHLANETTLHQLQAKNREISRMLGGWRKSVQ